MAIPHLRISKFPDFPDRQNDIGAFSERSESSKKNHISKHGAVLKSQPIVILSLNKRPHFAHEQVAKQTLHGCQFQQWLTYGGGRQIFQKCTKDGFSCSW